MAFSQFANLLPLSAQVCGGVLGAAALDAARLDAARLGSGSCAYCVGYFVTVMFCAAVTSPPLPALVPPHEVVVAVGVGVGVVNIKKVFLTPKTLFFFGIERLWCCCSIPCEKINSPWPNQLDCLPEIAFLVQGGQHLAKTEAEHLGRHAEFAKTNHSADFLLRGGAHSVCRDHYITLAKGHCHARASASRTEHLEGTSTGKRFVVTVIYMKQIVWAQIGYDHPGDG